MAWLYWGEIDGAIARAVGDEARHAVRVARVRLGERVSIGDGCGTVATGPVTAAGESLEIAVEETRSDPPPSSELWLLQALAKGDRDELAVQAATELGVSGVIPWQAERSVLRWEGPKAEKGRMRWQGIVREAAKQSIRSRIPEVLPVVSTRELAATAGPGLVLLLEPTADETLSAVELPASGRIALVVGPEGGISPTELTLLADAGAVAVRLGPEVLRTSTAGPAALAALNLRMGRW